MNCEAGSAYHNIRKAALAQCMERGYGHTSVADIAGGAGISHMTFFRHFATKHEVITDGIFDCFEVGSVSAIGVQYPSRPPLVRAIAALITALEDPGVAHYVDSGEFRIRMHRIAREEALFTSVWRAGTQLRDNLCRALQLQGTSAISACAVSGAAVGALLSIALQWARGGQDKKASGQLRRGLIALLVDGVRPDHVSH